MEIKRHKMSREDAEKYLQMDQKQKELEKEYERLGREIEKQQREKYKFFIEAHGGEYVDGFYKDKDPRKITYLLKANMNLLKALEAMTRYKDIEKYQEDIEGPEEEE